MTDVELRVLRGIARALPRVRGAGVVGNALRRWYARRPRPPVRADVLGATMELDPSEDVDGQLLFQPQLYDRRELGYLAELLRPGDVFVDVGAHIGTYALFAARRVGPGGRVLAIEADPFNAGRLEANLSLNPDLSGRVTVLRAGASDRDEVLRLGLNTAGNRSGNSFLAEGGDAVEVRCRPLAALLADGRVERPTVMKMDVEGFEYRVLGQYFEDVAPERWPAALVLEYQPAWDRRAGGSSLALVRARGYREVVHAGINRVLVLDGGSGDRRVGR